jgi:two-component system chemotaxis response regulator CheY
MNFLLVDRNATMRSIIRHELIEMGYRSIHQVGNAESALLSLGKKNYDVIITELELPGMDGIEFIKQVRKNQNLSNVKILIVSGSLSKEEFIYAMQNGANSCLVNPFSPNVVKNQLDLVIKT